MMDIKLSEQANKVLKDLRDLNENERIEVSRIIRDEWFTKLKADIKAEEARYAKVMKNE